LDARPLQELHRHSKALWDWKPDGGLVDMKPTVAFCPRDGRALGIQSEDLDSTIFAACPACSTEWESLLEGSFAVFEPGEGGFMT
jgi:hypothetical protein